MILRVSNKYMHRFLNNQYILAFYLNIFLTINKFNQLVKYLCLFLNSFLSYKILNIYKIIVYPKSRIHGNTAHL